MFNSILAI